jgi:WD40 repeat protein
VIILHSAHKNPITQIRFYRNDQFFITSGNDHSIKLWSSTNFTKLKTLHNAHVEDLVMVHFSNDFNKLIVTGNEDSIKVMNFELILFGLKLEITRN